MPRAHSREAVDPEALLRRLEAEEEQSGRGRLKIFLGYASGVGKSYRMLDEGRRRHDRGQDVVVGAAQETRDADISRLLEKLEVMPLKPGCGAQIDTAGILQRRPEVCLIDGLAYDNPPGSPNPSRWRDVDELLKAGISVITTINLGYIAEHQEEVARIVGKTQTQTVPTAFLRNADEIVVVDAPAAGAERDRERAARLREIALVLAAEVVDSQLESYLERNGVRTTWGTQERILLCLTPGASARAMIETGQRVAASFHGELLAAYVRSAARHRLDATSQQTLDENLLLAREAGATVHTLTGRDPMAALVEFARGRGVTQMFVGHSLRAGWRSQLFGGPIDRLLRMRLGMDVRVFPH